MFGTNKNGVFPKPIKDRLILSRRPCSKYWRTFCMQSKMGLPSSSSPPCQPAWMKCLTGCCRIAYSWTLRKQNHLPSAAVCVWENYVLPSTTIRDLSSHQQRCRYVVSCVVYGIWMFCCVMTAPQHQTLSVWFCVPFAGRVAGYATSRLLQRNTRRTSCVSAQSTSVGAQCRCQTDT